MQKWEYAIVHWEGSGNGQFRLVEFSHGKAWDKVSDSFCEILQKLGDDGWELTATIPTALTKLFDNGRASYAFKRPLT